MVAIMAGLGGGGALVDMVDCARAAVDAPRLIATKATNFIVILGFLFLSTQQNRYLCPEFLLRKNLHRKNHRRTFLVPLKLISINQSVIIWWGIFLSRRVLRHILAMEQQ
jgi:hypothetical protein